jgi:transglutaminase-like putative cysteine protease
LFWLLIAQAFVMAPHILRLPKWFFLIWAVCVGWRILIYQGRWFYPGKLIKIALVIASVVGIVRSYGNVIGLEPAVALLLSAYLLKLLEMRSKRDILLLIFLSYFVIVTNLLFSQTPLSAVYMLVCVAMVSTALIAMQQSAEMQSLWRPLKMSATMVLQALPLMLILFLVFPRIDPFWSVPLPSHQAKTGMSDSMSPGQVTRLAQSDALAFRVSFEGDIPQQSQLYWRGLVLSHFDGKSWTPAHQDRFDEPPLNFRVENDVRYRYEIVMEASQQPWLFTLPVAHALQGEAVYSQDYVLSTPRPIRQRMQFRVESQIFAEREPLLFEYRLERELQLPRNVNPRARQLAEQWRKRYRNDMDYANAVLRYFREKPFVYTLEPPALGYHSVDEFLFESRRGFCEHYASSFTFMLRAAGIPARVVAGYQGGTKSPYDNYLIVRQLDAHAWAEIWIRGRGWVRIDPTAAVAPERIELGSEEFLSDQSNFLADSPLSPLQFRDVLWLRKLQLRYDQINYSWHRWVLNYDSQLQLQTLKALLGEVTPQRLIVAVLISGGFILGLIALQFFIRQPLQHSDPVLKVYKRFCRKFARLGFVRRSGEGPRTFAGRIIEKRPDLKGSVNEITLLFEEIQYSGESPDKNKLQQLKKQVTALSIKRPRLAMKKKRVSKKG